MIEPFLEVFIFFYLKKGRYIPDFPGSGISALAGPETGDEIHEHGILVEESAGRL